MPSSLEGLQSPNRLDAECRFKFRFRHIVMISYLLRECLCYLGKKGALLKCPCNLCVKHNVLSDVKYALNAGIVDTHALNRWKCNLGDPHMWEVTTKWIYFRVKGCQ